MGVLQLKLIRKHLDKNNVPYSLSVHEPVYTSMQAAKIRKVELKTGVKALVLKTKEGNFILGLVAADKKINFTKLAKILETKSLQLALPNEVLKITGCEVGSVHPFGNLYNLPTYLDISILENDMVNFNAGLHTVTIQMKAKDLIEVIKPTTQNFSK